MNNGICANLKLEINVEGKITFPDKEPKETPDARSEPAADYVPDPHTHHLHSHTRSLAPTIHPVYPSEEKQRLAAGLRAACEPLIAFMNEHCNPHSKIIIQQGNAEILSGEVSINFPITD